MIEKILLTISIILNLILIVAVFFRTALNEIVKDWWIEKKQTKKEHKQRFLELRSNLLKLSRLSFTILIFRAMANSKEDKDVKAQMFNNSKPTLDQWRDINTDIEENDIHYPQDIRELYTKYRREMGKATEKVFLKSVYDQQSLIKLTDKVMSALGSIIEKVNYYIEN